MRLWLALLLWTVPLRAGSVNKNRSIPSTTLPTAAPSLPQLPRTAAPTAIAAPAAAAKPQAAALAAAQEASTRLQAGETSGADAKPTLDALFTGPELRHILGDAAMEGADLVWPVTFGKGAQAQKSRGTGLEGFLYTKLEHEKSQPATPKLVGDYFRHVDALLSAAPSAAALRRSFDDLGRAHIPLAEKNEKLNELLVAAVESMREKLRAQGPSLSGRQTATYMIMARAYNRLKPGENFFESFDEAEFARIKRETGANELWPMDIFEIGKINRWGTAGGSVFSIKGYRVKRELGGDRALRAFVKRAHAAGFKVKLDFIPNHTSLDSDMLRDMPEAFLHVVPPQNLSDAEILAAVPRENNEHRAPLYHLVKTKDSRRILVHHPRTEGGAVTWVDMAQIDFSRPQARERLIADMEKLLVTFGADSLRRDMAYELLSSRYYERWAALLESEIAATPPGWMRERSQRMLQGFTARWKKVERKEFLRQAGEAAKAVNPSAVMIDEAYGRLSDLSRAGSDGVYNKNDHDAALGQIGLYDAMKTGDAPRLRAALRHAAYRRWQLGGAAMVNYIGTHEEFEGNPVDVFGPNLKAAAMTALMLRPVLLFNGLEQGVGQRRNIIGDLALSADKGKAVPFDVPAKLNWTQEDADNKTFLRFVLAQSDKRKDLLDRGVIDVPEPKEPTPIVAWTAASKDSSSKILMAANYGNRRRRGVFRFGGAALAPLGAFEPRADREYILRDAANTEADRRVGGSELLEKGLTLTLDAGGARLYEIIEEGATAPAVKADPAATTAPRPLNIFIAAGESVPFMKTGGLADVVDAVGRGLAKSGQNVTVILPKYAELKPEIKLTRLPGAFAVPVNGRVETARLYEAVHEGVRFLFVEHDYYFARDGAYYGKNVDYSDNDERFIFFSRAVIEAARFLDLKPDVFHAHDWQAALVAPMLESLRAVDPFLSAAKSVVTIHNMAYQGRFKRASLRKAGLNPSLFPSRRGLWGSNFLDAGLRTSDAVTTVSPTYAREIQTSAFGEQLDDLLRRRSKDVSAVLNGIDPALYDPAADPDIARRYSIADLADGKAANKEALQKALGLPVDASVPVFAVASRFAHQKGIDLVADVIPELVKRGAQIVVAGTGDEKLEERLLALKKHYPNNVGLHGFSETFVKLIYAGHDFFLMPSRFEPCGLAQLISQRYGGLVLATPTGGLVDTIRDARLHKDGDGFFMKDFTADALAETINDALTLYSDKPALDRHRRAAMAKDASWDRALDDYMALYRRLVGA